MRPFCDQGPLSLLLRADCNSQIGTGHVMRCLALAQACLDGGGRTTFAQAAGVPALEERLISEGMEVRRLSVQAGSVDDAIQTADLAQRARATWVVVDGYHFDAGYQLKIKEAGLRLLLIDDVGRSPHYYADIVLNQNLHAHEGLYLHREPYTQLLLGTPYVLLRKEFFRWRGWKREIPEVARNVLVTLGGGDPDNVTLKVIQALQQVEANGLEAVVVVGASNSFYQELQSAIHDSRFPICLENNVTNVPDLMAWADVAVVAGGSTCWEAAFMSLPCVVLTLADNQRPVAEELEKAGVAVSLGGHECASYADIARALTGLLLASSKRLYMSQRGKELVDGQGSGRVLTSMESQGVILREVREEDCQLLWKWANDSEVRDVSFSPEPIPWERHVQWFKSKLNDPRNLLYIACNGEGVPIGQIRFELKRDEAVVSISVDRKCRGKGYGSAIISVASQRLFDISDARVIHAYVKEGNGASVQAFLKGGFKSVGTLGILGQQANHLVLRKDEWI